MTTMWQDILAWLIVCVAAGYVAQFAWRSLRGRGNSGCGGCGNCPGDAAEQEQIVVKLERPPVKSGSAAR